MRFICLLAFFISYITLSANEDIDSVLVKANELYRSGEYEQSLALLNLIKLDNKDTSLLKVYYYLSAINHQQLENYIKAIDCYHKSETINIEVKDSLRLVTNYIGLGSAYKLLNQNENSLYFYEKALNHITPQSQYLLGQIYLGLGNQYRENELYNEAIAINKKAEAFFIKQKDSTSISVIQNNLGVVYKGIGNLNKALEYYEKSLYIKKSLGHKKEQIISHLNIANTYRIMGSLKDAHHHYLTGLELTDDLNTYYKKEDLLVNLIELNNELGNTDQSDYYFKWYNSLIDTVFSIEKESQIAELQAVRDVKLTNEKLKEQELRTQIKEEQIVFLIIGISTLALASIVIIILFNKKNKAIYALKEKEKELQDSEFQRVIKNKEIESMQKLVEGLDTERKRIGKSLHDQIGAKASITKLLLSDNIDHNRGKISNLLDEITDDCRAISHNLHSGLLEKYGLSEAVEDLFNHLYDINEVKAEFTNNIEQKRFNPKIEQNLYFVIQELINNFLKHSKGNRISLNISTDQSSCLQVNYIDNGVGVNLDTEYSGIGLNNIKNRIKIISGDINMKNTPGLSVSIHVPF